MKTISFLVIIQIFCFCSFAQVNFPNGKIKTGKTIYNVVNTKDVHSKISIKNANNQLYQKKSVVPQAIRENYVTLIETGGSEKKRLSEIVKTALGKRAVELAGLKIFPQYFVDGTGKVLEINFLIDKESNLTLADISIIEEAIKTDFQFKITNTQMRGVNFVQFFWPLQL